MAVGQGEEVGGPLGGGGRVAAGETEGFAGEGVAVPFGGEEEAGGEAVVEEGEEGLGLEVFLCV